MKLLFLTTLALAAFAQSTPLNTLARQARRENAFQRDPRLLNRALALQESIFEHGCNVNVCFAIDGSSDAGVSDFARSIEFTQIIALITDIDPRVRNSALQFGRINSDISPLTGDRDTFIRSFSNIGFANAPTAFVSAGVLGCKRMLGDHRGGPRPVIVVVGAGGPTVGVSPQRIAERFFRDMPTGSILSISTRRGRAQVFRGFSPRKKSAIDISNSMSIAGPMDAAVGFICGLPRN